MDGYGSRLVRDVGNGWNWFWFQPRDSKRLGQMRILVGVLALWWCLSFSADLTDWFAAGGRLPAQAVAAWRSADPDRGGWGISWLSWISQPGGLWTVHAISLLVLVAFLVGFATRISSVLALLVVLAYVQRAPMLGGVFEYVLCSWMLYLCLAPVGQYASVDALRQRGGEPPVPGIASNIATRLLQVHLSAIYLAMGFFKLGGATWWMGEAVWWLAAQQDTPLVDLRSLSQYPYLLNAWTHAVVGFELAFAVLIWVPLLRPVLALAACVHWALVALLIGHVPLGMLMAGSSLVFLARPGAGAAEAGSGRRIEATRPALSSTGARHV